MELDVLSSHVPGVLAPQTTNMPRISQIQDNNCLLFLFTQEKKSLWLRKRSTLVLLDLVSIASG